MSSKCTPEEDTFVFVSAYMAHEELTHPQLLKELMIFPEKEQVPTVIGADANAHHTVWGFLPM